MTYFYPTGDLTSDPTYSGSQIRNTEGYIFVSGEGIYTDVPVTSFMHLFYKRNGLTLDLSTWDTSTVNNMDFAFYISDYSGDLSSWDVSLISSEPLGFGFNSGLSADQYPVWGTKGAHSFVYTGDITLADQEGYLVSIEPTLILDDDAIATLNEGVGIDVTGTGSMYIPASKFVTGDQVALKDSEGNNLHVFTVTDQTVDVVSFYFFSYLVNENEDIIIDPSDYISYLKVDSGDSIDIVYYSDLDIEDRLINLSTKCVNSSLPKFSNRESKESLSPNDFAVIGLTNKIKTTNRSGVYSMSAVMDKSPQGYRKSTVLLDSVPVPNTKVICFTNDGVKIAETLTNELGEYRFDNLQMRVKYLFVAKYNQVDELTPPDYQAVAADWQTPTPY